jgi:hypothetical protein
LLKEKKGNLFECAPGAAKKGRKRAAVTVARQAAREGSGSSSTFTESHKQDASKHSRKNHSACVSAARERHETLDPPGEQ